MVDIADEQEIAAAGQSGKQVAHEGHVQHGAFIHDQQIARKGIGGVAQEAAGAGGDFEQAMDGFGFHAGGFGEALGGAASGSAEEATDFLGGEDEQDGIDQRGFADARAAGDNEGATGERLLQGLTLSGGELLLSPGFAPGDGFFKIDGRVAGSGALEHHGFDGIGDGLFGAFEPGQINKFFIADLFLNEFLILQSAGDGGIDEREGNVEQLVGGFFEVVRGQRAMALTHGFLKNVTQAGTGAEE